MSLVSLSPDSDGNVYVLSLGFFLNVIPSFGIMHQGFLSQTDNPNRFICVTRSSCSVIQLLAVVQLQPYKVPWRGNTDTGSDPVDSSKPEKSHI